MTVHILGSFGVSAEVERATRALRITHRPTDYGTLGAYSAIAQTGVMAAGLAANAEILQIRWTDATRLAAVTDLRCAGAGSIIGFAAGVTEFEAIIARSWTVAGTGGATATLTTNNNKLRTSMGTSLMSEIRVATTAALGAGTKTLDTQGFANVMSSVTATAGAVMMPPDDFFHADPNDHPVILATNEGISVTATVPITGTWSAAFTAKWTELTAY